MTMIREIQVTCLPCHQSYPMLCYESINSDEPELFEAFLQDKLNIATCPSCGVSQFFPFPLVCNDMNRGLMIAIDEMLDTNSEDLGLQNDSDIEGVHYQRIPDDDVQIISVDDFEAARAAMLRLDDQAVIDSIKQAHPNWPGSLTYAEAFLRHYGAALESG